MQILAIDYGKAKTGVAVGDTETKLAEPLTVIRNKSPEDTVDKVLRLPRIAEVSRIVIGLSQGRNDLDAKKFGRLLEKKSNIEIEYWSEDFSTQFAIDKSIEAGIRQGKRKRLEDAYAACVILESYFDIDGL